MDLITGGIAAIVIPFLVQIIKKIKFIGTKHAALVAFILGIIVGIANFYITKDGTLTGNIIAGVAVGGTSTGLYSLTKKEILGQ